MWQWLVLAITFANATAPAIDERIVFNLFVLKKGNRIASLEVAGSDNGTSVTGNIGLLNACMKF